MAATVPTTVLKFMAEHISAFLDDSWEVSVVTSSGTALSELSRLFPDSSRPSIHVIEMNRSPTPLRDVRALTRWVAALRRLRPDVLLVGTPKAAMLGLVAGSLVGVPVRIYLVRGLRFEGMRGPHRWFGLALEWLACHLATDILSVSQSVSATLTGHGLAPASRITVLGSGSSHGVDAYRFQPRDHHVKTELREKFGLPKHALIVGFVGRLTRDKGVVDLLLALRGLDRLAPNIHLVIAGTMDHEIPLRDNDLELLSDPGITLLGGVESMELLYPTLDILCLPSYREGFPNVVLEALACGIPVVTTTATGCRDSVIPGVDGLMVEPGDVDGLRRALALLANDEGLRLTLGANARRKVVDAFSSDHIASLVVSYVRQRVVEAATSRTARRARRF